MSDNQKMPRRGFLRTSVRGAMGLVALGAGASWVARQFMPELPPDYLNYPEAQGGVYYKITFSDDKKDATVDLIIADAILLKNSMPHITINPQEIEVSHQYTFSPNTTETTIPLQGAVNVKVNVFSDLPDARIVTVKVLNPKDSVTSFDVTLNGTQRVKLAGKNRPDWALEDFFYIDLAKAEKNVTVAALQEGQNPESSLIALNQKQFDRAILPKFNKASVLSSRNGEITSKITDLGNNTTLSLSLPKVPQLTIEGVPSKNSTAMPLSKSSGQSR